MQLSRPPTVPLSQRFPTVPLSTALVGKPIYVGTQGRLSSCRVAQIDSPAVPVQRAPAAEQLAQQVAGALGNLVSEPVVKHVPWYAKPCPGYTDLHNVQELMAAVSADNGRYKIVEFYAGWCHSCKGSFQSVCKLAQDEQLQGSYDFYKANVEDESLFWWIKRNEVRGLPFMAVFDPEGQQLLGSACSMKKIPQIRAGLSTILEHPDSKRFAFNPQGVLESLE